MSQYSFSHTLKFACWNAEEIAELGSLEYAKYAYGNNIDVPLYMNLDGSGHDPDNRMILDVVSNNQSSWVSNMMTEYNALYGIDLTLTDTYANGSDHRSFWTYGYPAVWMRSETYGPIHSEWGHYRKIINCVCGENWSIEHVGARGTC